MVTITEDYVSFEIAKLLKDKGFQEPCTGLNKLLCKEGEKPLLLITHQKAMKWLREVYDIFIDIGYDDLDWYWLIESISKDIPYEDRPELIKNGTACHKTYEEAVEAALKYCLENLI